MRVTPGSETLWSVHSGHFCWTRRLASSTRSWKRRSSRFGTGSAMLTLLQPQIARSCLFCRNHVEGEDQVARIVGFPDRVADVDVQDARVLGIKADDDVADIDARLPATQ